MPITITANADERVRYTMFSGDVTDAELLDAYRCALAEPGYDPSLPGLIDLRDAGRLEITPSAVWELSNMLRQADPAGTQRRAAFVAPTDFLFGMARMFAALAESADSPTDYQVFRRMADARRWLGLDPTADE